jgi:GNAT superfamily N-acetyltransferase
VLSEIRICPFQAQDQAEVKALILAGLGEHWGTIDPSQNPDLDNIATSYSGATFLVAESQQRIIGAGALVPRLGGIGEIVRMSVAANRRRSGVGTLILRELVERARVLGYCRVILETTATWREVIEFYLRFGFQITHYREGDVYFALDITD